MRMMITVVITIISIITIITKLWKSFLLIVNINIIPNINTSYDTKTNKLVRIKTLVLILISIIIPL